MKISEITPLQEKQIRAYCSYLERENEKMQRENEKKIESARNDFKTFCILVSKNIEKFNNVDVSQEWAKCIIQKFDNNLSDLDINRSIYNLPPRLGKTTLITTLGVSYILGKFNNRKICIINANKEKIDEINSDIKQIIQSEIYQKIFKTKDISSKNSIRTMRFNNNNIISFKVSGSNVIGSGYHYIFFDDYLNPNNVGSEARMLQAKKHLASFLGRKEYNPASKIYIIEQRIDIEDTTGICKTGWDAFNIKYLHVSLPYEIKEDISIDTFYFKANTFLDRKFDEEDKNIIFAERCNLDPAIWQTQYQQNPIVSSGAIFKREFLDRYYFNPIDKASEGFFENIFISLDSASKTKAHNDYSAFSVIGIREGIYYILEILRYKEAIQNLENLTSDIFFKWMIRNNPILLIEDKSSGEGLITMIQQKGLTCRKRNITHRPILLPIKPTGSKEERAKSIRYCFEGKMVKLPASADWLIDFETELINFPRGKHDDQVDSVVNNLKFITSHNKNKGEIYY